MADNYQQATIEPAELPKQLFTEEDLGILANSGFQWDDDGSSRYFYAPEYLFEDASLPKTYCDVFQDAIRRSQGGVSEIVVMGALTCAKMRPGEFGGFVTRITASTVQSLSTSDILERFRSGAL